MKVAGISGAAAMTEAEPGTGGRSRVRAIDALRGLIMIVMAIDHVRDFFHADAVRYSPTDLTQTSVVLFFTRWITHFCLPVFMFTAGMGIFLRLEKSGRKGEMARFLVTRGLWFVLLELTVMRLAYNFRFSLGPVFLLLMLWIFGLCMMAMAALIYVRVRWLAAASIAVIVLHNTLDGISAAQLGRAAWVWNILHQPGIVPVDGHPVLVLYNLIPWLAVMAAGFCFARVFRLEPAARQKIMLWLGLGMMAAFVVVRAVNRYGDPEPWARQKSHLFTLLSFLNCTKYPASLDYLLMTLGPALVVLCWFDRRSWKRANPLIVFGSVPMFYFVCHFYLIHATEVVTSFVRFGAKAQAFVWNPVPTMFGPTALYPADFGYRLWVTYVVWGAIVVGLYPLCRWFARVKATRRAWWLSYL